MKYYGAFYPREKGMWLVAFPDFVDCFIEGKGFEEARAHARDALEVACAERDDLPCAMGEEAALRQALGHDFNNGCGCVLEPFYVPGKSAVVKINISMREDELADIDARARELGLSRSALLVGAALGY